MFTINGFHGLYVTISESNRQFLYNGFTLFVEFVNDIFGKTD